MKNKYISICFVTLTLSIFSFCWLKYFTQIEKSDWKESSTTKYEFFISQLKQSGEPSRLQHALYFLIVNLRDGPSQADFRSENI